jgi:hypothetical protein
MREKPGRQSCTLGAGYTFMDKRHKRSDEAITGGDKPVPIEVELLEVMPSTRI